MEGTAPHKKPGYELIYKVGLFTTLTLSFQMVTFDEFKHRYDGNNFSVLMIGLATFLCAVGGAIYANVLCNKYKSCKYAAATFNVLGLPVQLYLAYLQSTHKKDDFFVTMFLNMVNGIAFGGLITSATGFISKNAKSLTRGQMFGYFTVACAFGEACHTMLEMKIVSDKTFTYVGILCTLAGGMFWSFNDIVEDKEGFAQEDTFSQYQKFVPFFLIALSLTCQVLIIDGQLDQDTTKLVQEGDLLWMARLLYVVAAGAAACYVFAFDNNCSAVSRILAAFTVLGNLLWVYQVSYNDSRVQVFSITLMTLSFVLGFNLVFAQVTYNQNTNELNQCSQWVATWYLAMAVSFVVVQTQTDQQVLMAYLLVTTVLAVFQIMKTDWAGYKHLDFVRDN